MQQKLDVVGSWVMSNSAQRDAKDTRDESSRAADTDRIQLAQLLAYAAEQGRLQMKDYEDRLTRAYAATTYEELDRLRADLPGSQINLRRGGKPNPAPSTLLLALLSGFERRGRWNVPKKLTTFAFWGNGVVDLRYADFTSTEVDIHAISIMGATKFLLPPEVNVEIHGRGVMGNFDRGVLGQGTPGAPKVKIRGFSLWGGVGIIRKARRPRG
ncbi:hypothetical protein HMPREF0591_4780 [Mycobacterium parascrofulaceum ATCC BAA-614]|uniref:DUF1707 domain-containing protein n=2 Tax=Mycobacterium parascrofulaceum TaxID=240125 RepID=D5PF36_9MYCO|nr:hypothetical protein HMPREF0591_4780 [Mycobacterium parascrofulaceum ATCC BAA-614]